MSQAPRLWTHKWIVSLLASALLLSGVAVINGGPIYYPDTAAYLLDASKLAAFKAPFAVRPVFYGLAIWPLHWGTFFFLALLAQALVVAHVVYLTTRCCGCGLNARGFVFLVASLTILTPISFHVSHLLPDIFVGVLILTLFLLGFCFSDLSWSEICYLMLLATAASTFHLTAIPIGLALFVLSLMTAMICRGRKTDSLLVLAPPILACSLLLGFSLLVFQQLTFTPKNPPHLLARVLADGPGRDFLRVRCPQTRFALCEYKDRLTSVEDDFLWRLLPSIPSADSRRIKEEQGEVIRGTFTMFPVEVFEHMLTNTVQQLGTFQSETQVSQTEWDEFQATDSPLARSVERSLQAKRLWEKPALDGINTFHAGVVIVSLGVSIIAILGTVRSGLFRPAALAATVITGLVTNAFVCGALGGVFGRYEGRVVWLIPFTAMLSMIVLRRAWSQLGVRGRERGRTSQ